MTSSTTLMGLAASPGIAIGRCWPIDRRKVKTPKRRLRPDDVGSELKRLEGAIDAADEQLAVVREKVKEIEGTEHLAIIDLHRMMLKDEMLVVEVQRLVCEEHLNAEWAVRKAVRKIKNAFSNLADEYFKERRSDIDYVGERIIKNLMGEEPDVGDVPPEGAVVVAHDLSPADTALLLHERKVAAFVTDVGARTSHTSIVARALEIPAVVGVGRISSLVHPGDWIVVDGQRGLVVVNPSAGERGDYEGARQRWQASEQELLATRDLQAVTTDGVPVRLMGNIEFPEEVGNLLAHGGEGVGLYRTEFLYIGRQTLPTEEEHYRSYRQVLEALAPRPAIIRTFDLGGDKLPTGAKSHEPNPALGLRAVRFCLRHPDLFRPQLRAMLRASVHGNLKIMFPMVSGVAEVRAAKRWVAETCDELRREGHDVRMPPVGIMVELPSAAIIVDRLASECEFLSVGTNDLIQYTIAIDRQNKDVAYLYHPLHLAVLRLLKRICEAGRVAGIPVSMCGEMASEPIYALVLVGLGFSELSMTGFSVPLVKRVIRSTSAADARRLVQRLLELTTAEDIEREVRTEMARRFPGMFATEVAVGPAGG